MSNQWAKVVLDSIAPNGKRLITVEARYWRAIHCEVMTHRAFARNAASSRAIPFIAKDSEGNLKEKCTFAMLSNDPFLPDFIGGKQKGMQSGAELDGVERNRAEWIIFNMLRDNLEQCRKLDDLGVHKSIINRYLEPWSYITTLITATEWKNFFRLRIHPAAEKHFNDIAAKIKAAIDGSTPQQMVAGDWHMPYLDDWRTIPGNLRHKVSVARCARLSYLTHDGKRDIADDVAMFEKLLNPGPGENEPPHISPFEHVAEAMHEESARCQSGPFFGWTQYRKAFANENLPG